MMDDDASSHRNVQALGETGHGDDEETVYLIEDLGIGPFELIGKHQGHPS